MIYDSMTNLMIARNTIAIKKTAVEELLAVFMRSRVSEYPMGEESPERLERELREEATGMGHM